MKLHLPVKLRASLIAAVIAVSSSVYNAAYAYDYTGTNIDKTEVYNRTSGDTYTASDNITFATGQYTQDKLVSYISGETTLTADTVNFNNNFGPNSADLTVESEKTYNGNVNIIANDIKVAPGAKVILEDVSIVERTPEYDTEGHRVYDGANVVVNELGDFVVLNGSADAIDEAVKKQLNIQNLHDTPTVTQRPNDEQTVRLGDVTGKGNMALIGSGADAKDTMRTENIGTVDQRFGNVAIYGADVTTGKVNANTVGIAQSDVATDAFTAVGLDVDADSTLTSTDTITAGQPTGHVAIYGAVTAENDITLAHGTATDKDGLHPGSSVTSNHGDVTLIDIHADRSTVEATEGDVYIKDKSIVEGSVITAGEDVNVWDSTMKAGKDAEGNPVRNTVTAGEDMDINSSNVSATDADVADDLSIGNSLVNDSTFKVGDDTAINNSIVKDTTITATGEDSSLEINNSDLTNTDVTGLASDIVIKGHSNITSNKEAGFVISTSGTSQEADADGYTGGSIIIDKAAVSHGTITSGKDVADTGVEVTKDGTGIGVNLPAGEINIHDSEVSDMTISTAKGHVILRGSENPSQTPSTPIGANNNAKNINGFTTSLSALGVETDGNKNVLSIGVAARFGSGANNSEDVYVSLRIKDGADTVAVSINTAKFTTNNETPTFTFSDLALDPSKTYTFEFVKADGTLANVDLALKTGAGDKPSPVVGHTDWSAIVTAKLATNTVTDSTISTGMGHIEIIHSGVTDSAISTGEGSIAINDSVIMASDKRYITEEVEGVTVTKPANSITSEGNGNLFVEHDSTVSKTSISAEGISYNEDGAPVSDKNYIVDSTVTDSDITLWGTGADLEIGAVQVIGVAPDTTTVNHPAKVLGQTSLYVDDTITVKAGSTINLNGGAEDMNANIDADKLHIESVATEHATLTNGQIAIGTETVITGSTHINGQWLDLTNVNTKPVTAPAPQEEQGEGETTGLIVPGTLGNLIEKSGNAGVNILNSNVEIDAIYSKDSDDVASINHYFKYVNIGKDSTVDVNEDAFVDVYREAHWDSHHDTAGKGSTVTFEKNASLKDAYIWGTGNDSTAQGKFDTQTIVNGEAHIGNLKLSHEGVLSIVNATEAEEGKGTLETPVTDTHSYIANIGVADGNTGSVHGVLNVVGGTLTTPKLDQGGYMTLGLNGGIIELGEVTAAQGATVASAEHSVNPHVSVRAITDASITGVTETIGTSTIRTTLDRVYQGPTVYTYYYVACATGTLDDGTNVNEGDIIAISSTEPLGTGDAVELSVHDQALLHRVTQPMPELGVAADDVMLLPIGQVYTVSTPKELGTKTDGIASLTVGNDFSANNVVINAYETGTADADDNVTADPGTGVITIYGDLSGNNNNLFADKQIAINTMTGDKNVLSSVDVVVGSIGTAAVGETEAVLANENFIFGKNVLTGDVVGNKNQVIATEKITTGSITGDENTLYAKDTIKTGSITGDSNKLDTAKDIITGAITGDSNTLTAGTTIKTGAIEGDSNTLSAAKDITIEGGVTGDLNSIVSATGDIKVTGTIDGETNFVSAVEGNLNIGGIDGTANDVTAQGTIEIGKLSGTDQTVLAYANGLSKDDVAIHIGEFNAEGSSVGIATTTSQVYGTATGNGSIVIDSMTAVEGTPDASLVNTIVSNNSFVHIGSMDGSNAYTQITAATTVTVGSPFTFATGADTGANMAIKGQDFVIASTDGVELTDSTVNVTDSITGSALTLTTTGTEKFISSADTVTLGSLTLGGAAMLNANQVNVDKLTIDGANATLDSTYVTADTVVLKNGGQLGSTRVDATNLTVQDSSFGFTSLNGIDSLTIDNSQGSIQQALTGLTGDVTVTNDSTLNMQSGLATDGKITVDNGSILVGATTVTGKDSIEVNDGTLQAVTITTDGDLTVTDGNVNANSSIAAGALKADGANVTATNGITLDNGDMTATNGSAIGANVTGAKDVTITDSTAKDIAMNGNLTTDTAEIGKVTGAKNVSLTDTTAGAIAMNGTLTADNATTGKVTGTVTEATISNGSDIAGPITTTGNATVSDSAIHGALTAAGDATTTNSTIDGAVSGANTSITGGSAASATATTGTVSTDGATIAGAVTGATGATVNGGSAASVTTTTGTASATNATIAGAVTGADAAVTGGTTGNVVATTGDATISGAQVGDVTATAGTADLTNATAGTVTAKDADITGGTAASVTATDSATLTDATVNGTVQAGDATITGGTTGNVVATTGDATISGAQVGDVTANAGTADLTNTVAGDISAKEADVTNSTTGDIAAKDVTLADATTGAVTATGSTTVASDSTTDTLSTKDLTVADGASVTADTVTADGKLDIKGDVTADTVTLTGTTGSVIDGADVEATDGNVTLNGTVATTDSTLKGDDVVVNGTVNAGAGTAIDGTLKGDGTINKTGGDTLAIADADGHTNINVKDASTLQLADGTKVGKVDASAEGAKLIVGEEGSIDKVTVDKLTLGNKNTITMDADLSTGKADKVSGPAALNGATIALNTVGDETKIADQTSIKLFDTVTSAAADDVEHGMKTLNAYAKGDSIVLSKNFRGAEGLTKNQKSTAAALADVQDTMAPTAEMADMFDALAHTRSEADATDALESLSGAGLATISKMVTDEAHEHLQTLRSTMKSLSAGVTSRFDETGHLIEGINSSAITAVATGGTTRINDDRNAQDYSRNSYGVQLAGVHALTPAWTGGISAAYSHATGDCGPVDIETEGLFLDIAVMHKGYRVTQTASLGCGHFDIDTERMVNVAAPGHDFSGKAEGSTSAMAVTISYEAVATILTNEDHSQDLAAVFQADIVHAQFDSFTESGLGNAGLISEIDDVTSASCAIGARYTANFGEETNPGYFMAEALFVADAGDREAKINNRFIGGGQSFELNGPDAGACGLRLNAGVLVPVADHVGIFGNVSGEFRAHQTSVSGGVGVKVAF